MSEKNRTSAPRANTLAYEPNARAKGQYQKLVFDKRAIYFPAACCDCLCQTTTRYTIRGNRLRTPRSLGELLISGVNENLWYQMQVPVCNRCWNQFQGRRRAVEWIAPLAGAGAALLLGAAFWLSAARDNWTNLIIIESAALFFGVLAGILINKSAIDSLAKPPAIVRLSRLTGQTIIRLRNPDYVRPFLTAQSAATQQAAEQIAQISEPAPTRARAPVPGGWFYVAEGQTTGPVRLRELKEMAARGILQRSDLVWTEGQPKWVRAGSVPGMFPAA